MNGLKNLSNAEIWICRGDRKDIDMQLDIVTPDEQVYSGEVKLVKLPGVDGSFEILNNHAPLISTLEKGKIKIIEENNEIKFFEINDGVVEVQNNKVIVLAGSV